MVEANTGLAGRRVAVTGATGFIGGYVTRELAAAGATVIAVVERSRQVSRHRESAAAETMCFDAPGELVEAVRAAQSEFVVHLHAAISPAREVAAVRTMVEANLLPSIGLMTACLEMGVQRLVLLGSGEEFGPGTGRSDDRSAADPGVAVWGEQGGGDVLCADVRECVWATCCSAAASGGVWTRAVGEDVDPASDAGACGRPCGADNGRGANTGLYPCGGCGPGDRGGIDRRGDYGPKLEPGDG